MRFGLVARRCGELASGLPRVEIAQSLNQPSRAFVRFACWRLIACPRGGAFGSRLHTTLTGFRRFDIQCLSDRGRTTLVAQSKHLNVENLFSTLDSQLITHTHAA